MGLDPRTVLWNHLCFQVSQSTFLETRKKKFIWCFCVTRLVGCAEMTAQFEERGMKYRDVCDCKHGWGSLHQKDLI